MFDDTIWCGSRQIDAATGLSAVFDCGIAWSYSLTILGSLKDPLLIDVLSPSTYKSKYKKKIK